MKKFINRLYLKENVFDAALNRIRWVFDEFPNVIVAMSGGKDSTVVFSLALMVAKEKNRLPLSVLFVDQECEWSFTIDYIRTIRDNPDVDLKWLQVPIGIANSASGDSDFTCWGENEKWMRDKEPGAIHEAPIGREWYGMFPEILKWQYGKEKVCLLTGIRAQEAPRRAFLLTSHNTFKGRTWGKILHKKNEQFNMSPLYDWGTSDIWTSIHRNGWKYCRLYDEQYAKGVPINGMRLSSLHHETALQALTMLQEIDRKTWDAVVERIPGANTIKHLNAEAFNLPKELPWMFKNWDDYRAHLVKYLVPEADKEFHRNIAEVYRKNWSLFPVKDKLFKQLAKTALNNDLYGTYMRNFETGPDVQGWRFWISGKPDSDNPANKLIVKSKSAGHYTGMLSDQPRGPFHY